MKKGLLHFVSTVNYLEECLNEMKTWKRYHKNTLLLKDIIMYSLNKEKNKNKGNFEDIPLEKVIHLLVLELKELKIELTKDENSLDYERIIEEIADVGACLNGLLAKILNMYSKRGEK